MTLTDNDEPLTADTAEPFRIEAVPGHLDGTSIGICNACGHPTLKKGSVRKARAAIVDHIRGKHPEIRLD